jgi:lysine-N-methylase
MLKYTALGREDILSHIEDGEIQLCENGRCPFLLDSGLCRLISELGDSYTSLICQRHPRFYRRVGDRIECGLGLSCEEACRIVLSSDGYSEFVTADFDGEVAEETDFDTISHREYLYSVLKRPLDHKSKVDMIKRKYDISDIHSAEEWEEILSSIEYLDDGHQGMFKVGSNYNVGEEYLERFLAYLIFRHLSIATSEDNLRARLGFCLLLCDILAGYLSSGEHSFDEICDFVRIISEEIEYSEDNTDSLIFEFEII